MRKISLLTAALAIVAMCGTSQAQDALAKWLPGGIQRNIEVTKNLIVQRDLACPARPSEKADCITAYTKIIDRRLEERKILVAEQATSILSPEDRTVLLSIVGPVYNQMAAETVAMTTDIVKKYPRPQAATSGQK